MGHVVKKALIWALGVYYANCHKNVGIHFFV